jgi:BirA family biotin operon repressor/biotin-[acetyl-CoA-carboxylase] ligase
MTSHDVPPAGPAGSPSGGRPFSWGAESLWQALEPLLPGLTIEVVERIDSTNTELSDRLRRASRLTDRRESGGGRSDDLQPQLLVATHQTSGRGRLGRRWHSEAGASLTFSLALPLDRPDWSGLSLAVGLAIAEALDPAGARLGLKWPNDVMLREPGEGVGRKLGGILIESVVFGTSRVAIVGVGLNVRPPAAESDLGVASVSEFDAAATARDVLAAVGPALARALVAFEREGFAPCVEPFGRRDVLRGRRVTTTDPAMPEGVAAGVDADGALRLVAGDTTHRVISGEVSVRPVAAR